MAGIIWADPAIQELDAIADYIALENVAAAREVVRKVFEAAELLRKFPRMGSLPIELIGFPCRQLIVSPCRVFYRTEKKTIYIVHVHAGSNSYAGNDSPRNHGLRNLPANSSVGKTLGRAVNRSIC